VNSIHQQQRREANGLKSMKEATLFRSEQYLEKARQCGRIAETARIPGAKRLYEELARQWRYLAEQADARHQVGERSHLHAHRVEDSR
jgi:hypothetical protein